MTKPYSPQWRYAFLTAIQFFIIIFSFWILKPLKKGLFIQYFEGRTTPVLHWVLNAAQMELLAKFGNVAVALLAMTLFIQLSNRVGRRLFFPLVCAVVLGTIGAVTLLLSVHTPATMFAFYMFGDLFNMLMVAGFFAQLSNTLCATQAKQFYGPIVLGGVIGGATGASTIRGLIDILVPLQWMGLVAALTTGVLFLSVFSQRIAASRPDLFIQTVQAKKTPTNRPPKQTIGQIRFVLAIGAMVVLYELISTIIDFQFTTIVEQTQSGAAIGRTFSTVYMMVNIVSLVVQVGITTPLLTRAGVKRAITVLPLLLTAGSILFCVMPILLAAAMLLIGDNALNYTLHQSARESLYTALPPSWRNRAKATIDILLQRSAKALGVLTTLTLTIMLSPTTLAVITLGLCALFVKVTRTAGIAFEHQTNQGTAKWDDEQKSNQPNPAPGGLKTSRSPA